MKRLLSVVTVGAAILAGSCGAPSVPSSQQAFLDRVKTELQNEMFDYPSARFQNVRLATQGDIICGEVNGKNQLGAYTGWSPFVFSDDGTGGLVRLPATRPCGEPPEDWLEGDISSALTYSD